MVTRSHDPDQHGSHKREAPGAGQHETRQGMGPEASERAQRGEKPKTERASHQGGGQVRTDHTPRGK